MLAWRYAPGQHALGGDQADSRPAGAHTRRMADIDRCDLLFFPGGFTATEAACDEAFMREGRRPSGWTADRDPFYLETSVPGIFVAGDVRHRSAKGVTSGVGEGAMAVKLVHEYLGLL